MIDDKLGSIDETIEAFHIKYSAIIRLSNREAEYFQFLRFLLSNVGGHPDRLNLGRLLAGLLQVVRSVETDPNKMFDCLRFTLDAIEELDLPCFIYKEDYQKQEDIMSYQLLVEFQESRKGR